MDMAFLFRGQDVVVNLDCGDVMVAQFRKHTKTTELCALSRRALWHVNYISIKLF